MSGEDLEHVIIASWPLALLGPSQGLLMASFFFLKKECSPIKDLELASGFLVPPPYIAILKDAFYSSQGAPAEPRPGEASLF